MVHKRDAWTRARDRWRRRPKPPPQTGWRIAELASLSGQPRRTIGYYVQQGLLAKPTFRGTAARYGRVHLLRLLCIEHLQREGAGTLRQIEQRLEAMSEAELWAVVSAQSLGADVARALGLAAPSGPVRGNGSSGGALPNRRIAERGEPARAGARASVQRAERRPVASAAPGRGRQKLPRKEASGSELAAKFDPA